jgi:hypothetical protein
MGLSPLGEGNIAMITNLGAGIVSCCGATSRIGVLRAREAVCLPRGESRRLETAGRTRRGAVGRNGPRAATAWHLRTAAESIK